VSEAHACNPGYLGVRDGEVGGSRPAWTKSLQSGLRCGSSSREPGNVAKPSQSCSALQTLNGMQDGLFLPFGDKFMGPLPSLTTSIGSINKRSSMSLGRCRGRHLGGKTQHRSICLTGNGCGGQARGTSPDPWMGHVVQCGESRTTEHGPH
jgi:hypothetical protein